MNIFLIKYKFVLAVLFVITQISTAQNPTNTLQQGEGLVKWYIEIGDLKKARKINQHYLSQPKYKNIATINQCLIEQYNGDLEKAKSLINQISESDLTPTELFYFYETMVQYIYALGNFSLTLEYQKKSYQISKTIDDINIQYKGKINMIYYLDNYINYNKKIKIKNLRLEYNQLLKELEKDYNKVHAQNKYVYVFCKIFNTNEDNVDTLRYYNNKLKEIGIDYNHTNALFDYHSNATYYDELTVLSEEEHLRKADSISKYIDWYYVKAKTNQLKASYYYDHNDFDRAKKEILEYNIKPKYKYEDLFILQDLLLDIYKAEKKYDSALIVQANISEFEFNRREFVEESVLELMKSSNENDKKHLTTIAKQEKNYLLLIILFLVAVTFFILYIFYQKRNANIKLNILNKELLDKNNFLKNYINLISYDLRESLSSILSLSNTFKKDDNIKEIKKGLHLIEYKGNQSMTTLTSIVAKYNIQNKKPQNLKSIQLYEVLSIVKNSLDSSLEIHKTLLNIDVDRGLSVKGDKEFLIRLFQNLIQGVLINKMTKKKSEIHLTHHSKGNYLIIKINYIGELANQLMKKIMTEEDNGPDQTYKSDGLGIEFCKDIMEYHKGNFKLNNQTEGSVEFILEFPA